MENQINSGTLEDFRMKYKIIIEDIKYTKSRQWTVTYWLLLLYGAILSFCNLIELDICDSLSFSKIFLLLLSFSICLFGTFYQKRFQDDLYDYRNRLRETILHLSTEFQNLEMMELENKRDGIEGYLSWHNGFWSYTFPFILMLWVGFAFVCWYVFWCVF